MLDFLGNLLHHVAARRAGRRELRRAYAKLSALDDRSLADIGISRSEIAYALTHSRDGRERRSPTVPAAGALRHAA